MQGMDNEQFLEVNVHTLCYLMMNIQVLLSFVLLSLESPGCV